MDLARRATGARLRLAGCLAIAAIGLALAAPTSAIVGGTQVAPGTWSWTARISVSEPGEDGLCTGSLVAPSVVLTAAHCVIDAVTGEPFALSQFSVLTGRTDIGDTTHGQVLEVTGVEVDPDFSPATVHADVALLQLAAPSAGLVMKLVTSADAHDYDTGSGMLVAGWGLADPEASTPPDTLQSVAILARANADCADALAGSQPYSFDPTTMFCGSGEDPGAGICRGDSGGPAVSIDAANELIQIGVVSWNLAGCVHPDVFVRLTAVTGWLVPEIAALEASAPKPAPPPVTQTATTATTTAAPVTTIVETVPVPASTDDGDALTAPVVVDAEGPGTRARPSAVSLSPASLVPGRSVTLGYRVKGTERFRLHLRITDRGAARYTHTTGWLAASDRRRVLTWKVPKRVSRSLRACMWATTAQAASPLVCATLPLRRG